MTTMETFETTTPDGTHHIYDEESGQLLIAFGPDEIEEGEEQDEHWIATLYDDDYPCVTFDGTRTAVAAQVQEWLPLA